MASTYEAELYQRELAVALGYRPGSDLAPRVLAAGQGGLARRIRQLARDAGVELQEDEELAGLLARIPAGEEIPAELFPAVAQIFAFLYRLTEAGSSERAQTDLP